MNFYRRLRIILFLVLTIGVIHIGSDLLAQEKSNNKPEAQKTDRLFNEIFRPSDPQNDQSLHTGEIGQVLDMRLSAGWRRGERRGSIAYSQAFHLKSNADVMLVFSYRGYRLSRGAASEFTKILSQYPGNVSSADFHSLPEIIGPNVSKINFVIDAIRVDVLNNKKVLSVEGRYSKDPVRRLTLYIDADRSEPGTVVQEISYIAPVAEFDKHIEDIRASFRSILWK